MNEHDKMLRSINLKDYDGILSRKNTWYLLDEDTGIWFTKSIPGTGSYPEYSTDQYDVYTRFNFCMCFGYREDTPHDTNNKRTIIITNIVNMCQFIYNDPRFVKDEDGNIYFCVRKDNTIENRLFLGTVLFSGGLDMDSNMLRRFKTCSPEYPIRLQLDSIRKHNRHTKSIDDIFGLADEPLESAFRKAFYNLQEQYKITNRETDICQMLIKAYDKILV